MKKNRRIITYVLAAALLLGGAVIGLIKNRNGNGNLTSPEQFAVFGQTPYVLMEGLVYRYAGKTEWEPVELPGAVKQLIPGEEFCVLLENGKIFYEGNIAIEEDMPLTGAFYADMAKQLLDINETMAFVSVSNAITDDVMVLLEDGSVLAQTLEGYQVCELEEKAAAVSGCYILTETGNLYFREENSIVPLCIYDGQDLVSVTAGVFDRAACIGLKEDEHAVSFGRGWHRDPYSGTSELTWVELPVTDWQGVMSAAQGNHFAVGLTEKGQLLYAGDFTEDVNETAREELAAWEQVTAVTIYNTMVHGVKADGSCIFLEIDP